MRFLTESFQWQAFKLRNKITFQKLKWKLIYTSEGTVVYPELGTWAEDWSMTHYPNGSEILDQAEIEKVSLRYQK